jgi:hypothetical protein
MRTTVFLLFCFLCYSASNAQVVNLTGTWTMFEMTYKTGNGDNKVTEEQMKANSSVTDYFFMEEGKFKMTSNMAGTGTMDTYEGTWKLAENKLTLSLKIGENLMDIVWDFELKDNKMNLSRTSPDGSITIINNFKRK